jgi:hypothetical protein
MPYRNTATPEQADGVHFLQGRWEARQVVLGNWAHEATHGNGFRPRPLGHPETDATVYGPGKWSVSV